MQVGPPFYPQNQVDVLGNDYFGLLNSGNVIIEDIEMDNEGE